MLSTLLLFSALAAATPAAAPTAAPAAIAPTREQIEAQRYRHCLDLAATKPAEAISYAIDWRVNGGGVPSRQCLGLAYLTQKDYPAAIAAFESAARAAEVAKSPQTAALWGQAGNTALLAGDPKRALGFFNSGLAAAGDTGPERPDLLIDHGRAAVELGDLDGARADIAKAVALDPESGDGWLLTATIERSAGDLPAAEAAILKAGKLLPGDIDVALEAGNIAFAQGKLKLARAAWGAIVKVAPADPAGIEAARLLKEHPDTAG
jgi:tetratricopeptide (TPR) repeat protein